MEKDGKPLFTQQDIDQYNKGSVSARIEQTWGFTFNELHEIITTSNYELLPPQEDNKNHGC